MQYNALVLAAIASVAVAQTATTTAASAGSTCAAQNILDACKSSQQAQLSGCAGNDWSCLCNNWTNLLTCYNNCPNDPVRASVQQSVTQYCNAASAYPSSTTRPVSAATSGTAIAATATTSEGTSGTASASSSTSTGSAAGRVEIAGGLLAVALAGFGLVA